MSVVSYIYTSPGPYEIPTDKVLSIDIKPAKIAACTSSNCGNNNAPNNTSADFYHILDVEYVPPPPNSNPEVIFTLYNKSPSIKNLVFSFSVSIVYNEFIIDPEEGNPSLRIDGPSSNADVTASKPIGDQIGSEVRLTFKFKPFREISSIIVSSPSQLGLASTSNIINNANTNLRQALASNNDNNLGVDIFIQTDALGLNLGEMVAIVDAKKSYPNGYAKRGLGVCSQFKLPHKTPEGLIQTFYSQRPDLSKVLKGRKGPNLFEQITYINRRYNTGESDCNFYIKILQYSGLKYMFYGLCSGRFSLDILYSDNNQKFINCMRQREFAKYLVVFKLLGIADYNKYFKSSYRENGNKRHESTKLNKVSRKH